MENQDDEKSQTVDVERALKEKSPKLYKIIPSFVIKFLKKIIHQDEINKILEKFKTEKGLKFIQSGLEEMGVKTTSIGLENLPENETVIIVSNHPLGGLDGVAILQEIGKIRNDIHIMVNDILMQIKNFEPLFVPVNKHGVNSRENLTFIESLYSSNKCVILFPAGLVSRKQGKEIKDLEWKKSFITQSIKHKKNIIPVFTEGVNSKKFYRIALWRKKLGIKINIEMLFLADEMFKQKGNTIHFKIGKAISWETFNETNSHKEWAQKVKNHVYALKNNNEKYFLPTIDQING